MVSSRPCHSPQLYPQIQPCLVSPRHQSHKKVRKSHQSFFQSQRDCSIQPSGCEERATLGKKTRKITTLKGLNTSALHAPMQPLHSLNPFGSGPSHAQHPPSFDNPL